MHLICVLRNVKKALTRYCKVTKQVRPTDLLGELLVEPLEKLQ